MSFSSFSPSPAILPRRLWARRSVEFKMLDVLLSNMHSVIILCIDYRGPYVNMPRTVNGNKVDFIYLLLVVL